MGTLSDLNGRRFGRLTVIMRASSISGNARWDVRCDCGTEKTVWAQDLKKGKVVSCGCHKAELASKRLKQHGMSQHPAYGSWRSMHNRCEVPEAAGYNEYGGRGIKVCPQWESFDQFWVDMGPTWRPRLSLDRIDVNGDYEPSNVRWATSKQQGNNRRDNHMIDTPDGLMTIAQAAEKYGLSHKTITARIRYGWTGHALVKPAMDKTEYLKQYRK